MTDVGVGPSVDASVACWDDVGADRLLRPYDHPCCCYAAAGGCASVAANIAFSRFVLKHQQSGKKKKPSIEKRGVEAENIPLFFPPSQDSLVRFPINIGEV